MKPFSPEDEDWFSQIQSLRDSPVDVAFAELVSIEPALEQVVAEVREMAEQSADGGEQRDGVLGGLIWDRICDLVGTSGRSAAPIAQTTIAWYVARDYLREVAGLPDLSQRE